MTCTPRGMARLFRSILVRIEHKTVVAEGGFPHFLRAQKPVQHASLHAPHVPGNVGQAIAHVKALAHPRFALLVRFQEVATA